MVTSMSGEANIDSIRALERRINEGNGDITSLKRIRNSLLNISKCTIPEILGNIFVWSLVQEYTWIFQGLQKGPYNFLLVCHHWFEVACRTPVLWSFWGNTLQDWKRCHHRSGAIPLDLVLDGDKSDPSVLFDKSLQDAVRSRAVQGSIQQVHLRSGNSDTLASIISSLTPNNEGSQNRNIESIIWRADTMGRSVDVSDFFARSHLPKLPLLNLSGGIRVSSWDYLAPRTTLLTTLSLKTGTLPPSTLTAPQLFSILTNNPGLRELTLARAALPNIATGSMPKVPLRNLKNLSLIGEFRCIFWLLHQLILPETLDRIDLDASGCTVEDVSQTLAPYIRDHYRRDARFQDDLEVSSRSDSGTLIGISVTVVYRGPFTLEDNIPPAGFTVLLTDEPPPDVLKQLFIDLIALIPRGQVEVFSADLEMEPPEEVLIMMPTIERLYVAGLELSEGFLQPNKDGPHANTKLLPSLEYLCLEDFALKDNDWRHLTTYLAHQASGGQAISLEMVAGCPDVPPEVVSEIRGMVRGLMCPGGSGAEEDLDCYYY